MLLLIFSLLIAATTHVIPVVKAWDDPKQASNLYSSEWQVGSLDSGNLTVALSQIYDMFEDQQYFYWVWWWPYTPVDSSPVYYHLNNFEAETTENLVTSEIDYCEDNHEFTAIFYYGHMGMSDATGLDYPYWNYGFREQATLDGPEPDTIWDTDIYYSPTVDNHHFVFLWVCNNGNIGGATNPVYGMPRCWTRVNLSPDGYGDPLIEGNPDSSSYCFIGFEGMSPGLAESLEAEQGYQNYKYWLVFFYHYLLEEDESVQAALWYASYNVGYEGWLDEENRLRMGHEYYWPGWIGDPENKPDLYPDADYYPGKMRIYGDGSVHLPVSENVVMG